MTVSRAVRFVNELSWPAIALCSNSEVPSSCSAFKRVRQCSGNGSGAAAASPNEKQNPPKVKKKERAKKRQKNRMRRNQRVLSGLVFLTLLCLMRKFYKCICVCVELRECNKEIIHFLIVKQHFTAN